MLKTFFAAAAGQTSDVQCHVDGDLLVDPHGKNCIEFQLVHGKGEI